MSFLSWGACDFCCQSVYCQKCASEQASVQRKEKERSPHCSYWKDMEYLWPNYTTFYFRLPNGSIESTSLDVNYDHHIAQLRSDASQYEWSQYRHKVENSTDFLMRNINRIKNGTEKTL